MTILPYVLGATPNPETPGTAPEAAPGFEVALTQAEAGEVLAPGMPTPEVGEVAPFPVELVGIPIPTPGAPPWPPGEAQPSAAEEVAPELPIGAEPKLDLESAQEQPEAAPNLFPLAALFAMDLIPAITTSGETATLSLATTSVPAISPATQSPIRETVEVPTLGLASIPEEFPAAAPTTASPVPESRVVISAERIASGEEIAPTEVLDRLRLREVTVPTSPPEAIRTPVGQPLAGADAPPAASLPYPDPVSGEPTLHAKPTASFEAPRPSAPNDKASPTVTPPTPVTVTLPAESPNDEPSAVTRPIAQPKPDPTPSEAGPQPSRSTIAEPKAQPVTNEPAVAAPPSGAVEIAEDTDTLVPGVKPDSQAPTPTLTSAPIGSLAETVSTAPTSNRVETGDAQPEVLMQRVVDQIETLAARRPGGSVTIKLDPEDLGEITLTVRSFGQALTADLQASQPQTASTLEANKAQLVTQLESRGHQVSSVSVTTSTDSSLTQGQSQGQNGQAPLGRDDFQRAVNLREVAAASLSSSPVNRAFERPSQGVDVLI